ncbi:hypothetical protein AQI95_11970 [Streptomyces yokosukanensis]|uniref:DUF3558 domain-containing protein n=1 Tax=Streptomyces yokosukanensis TaxID=67386 RepID=A0A101P8M9_9ACTN|nr:hypothetical protein [Streptomyces yokosukanensis]KUN06967.1 hypothetical protein AQI95_11970 [Streptomyces yokosukanensis]
MLGKQNADGEGQQVRRKESVVGVRVAALMVAVVLLAAGCGGSGAEHSKGPGRHAATPDLATSLRFSQLKKVLDLQSMPTGWKVGATSLRGRDLPKDSPCRRPSGVCAGMTSHAEVQYDNADSTGNVHIELDAYEDREAAQTGYTSRGASYADKNDREISMPTVGNASVARTGFNKFSAEPFTSLVMRVGAVVVAMTYTHQTKPDPQLLLSVARMEAERIQQAEQGVAPTASLGHEG